METRLADGMDVRFPFTNYTDEEFIGKWDSKGYAFPAHSTTPLLGLIMSATPLELQGIRKKFAKDLAEREFGQSPEYQKLQARERNADGTPRLSSFQHALAYSETDLISLIQRALEPLPLGKARVEEVVSEPLENKLNRDDEGNFVTEAISSKTSLKKRALAA